MPEKPVIVQEATSAKRSTELSLLARTKPATPTEPSSMLVEYFQANLLAKVRRN